MNDKVIGFIGAFISIVFFGSIGLPVKSKRVVEAKANPVVFQLYYSLAVFITSWSLMLYLYFAKHETFEFTYLGVVAASLWVPASILSIYAINFIGLSVAQGVWSGVTIVVSFMWGAIVFHQEVKSIGLAVVALILLMVGIAGLSMCENEYYVFGKETTPEYSTNASINATHPERTPLVDREEMRELKPAKAKLLGLFCATLLGLFNGSMMVPTHYLPESLDPLMYCISFAIGVMIVTPVVATLYFIGIAHERPDFNPTVIALPASISGCLWNIGNIGSIYATKYLGLTVGFPLTQLALLTAGVWGMFFFGELKGTQTRVQFALAAVVLLCGAGLLSVFG